MTMTFQYLIVIMAFHGVYVFVDLLFLGADCRQIVLLLKCCMLKCYFVQILVGPLTNFYKVCVKGIGVGELGVRSKSKFVLLTVTLYKVNPFKVNIVITSLL